ncbi:MAG: hypothetical protein ACE368_08715 [Paracoccaceae bacterium]
MDAHLEIRVGAVPFGGTEMLGVRLRRKDTEAEKRQVNPAIALTRMLIASYFLLTATQVLKDPVTGALVGANEGAELVQFVLSGAVIIAAMMVMTSRLVRQGALFLAVYVIWSMVFYYGANWASVGTGEMWREATLVGALLLVAFSAPVPACLRHDSSEAVAPLALPSRPVRKPSGAAHKPRKLRPQASRSVSDEAPADPAATISGVALDMVPADRAKQDDGDAAENIFADIWDDDPRRSTTRAA